MEVRNYTYTDTNGGETEAYTSPVKPVLVGIRMSTRVGKLCEEGT